MRLRYSDVTPEPLYVSRRELMVGAAALALTAGAGEAVAATPPAGGALEGPPHPALPGARPPHQDRARNHLQQLLRVRDQQGRPGAPGRFAQAAAVARAGRRAVRQAQDLRTRGG